MVVGVKVVIDVTPAHCNCLLATTHQVLVGRETDGPRAVRELDGGCQFDEGHVVMGYPVRVAVLWMDDEAGWVQTLSSLLASELRRADCELDLLGTHPAHTVARREDPPGADDCRSAESLHLMLSHRCEPRVGPDVLDLTPTAHLQSWGLEGPRYISIGGNESYIDLGAIRSLTGNSTALHTSLGFITSTIGASTHKRLRQDHGDGSRDELKLHLGAPAGELSVAG